MKLEFPWQIFENSSYIKFYENLFSGRQTVTSERAGGHVNRQRDREIEMTMLKVDLRNFEDVPKSPM